jgi:hypothetical protein
MRRYTLIRVLCASGEEHGGMIMRYAALFVIAVTVLAFASTAGASVDLVASSIEFDQGEEGDTIVLAYVEVWRTDEEFDFDVALKLNGETVYVEPDVQVTEEPGGNCPDCPTSQCLGGCKVKVNGKQVHGTCSWGDPCSPGTGYECICSVDVNFNMGEYTLTSGDEVEIVVTAEGVDELSTTNNTLTTEY